MFLTTWRNDASGTIRRTSWRKTGRTSWGCHELVPHCHRTKPGARRKPRQAGASPPSRRRDRGRRDREVLVSVVSFAARRRGALPRELCPRGQPRSGDGIRIVPATTAEGDGRVLQVEDHRLPSGEGRHGLRVAKREGRAAGRIVGWVRAVVGWVRAVVLQGFVSSSPTEEFRLGETLPENGASGNNSNSQRRKENENNERTCERQMEGHDLSGVEIPHRQQLRGAAPSLRWPWDECGSLILRTTALLQNGPTLPVEYFACLRRSPGPISHANVSHLRIIPDFFFKTKNIFNPHRDFCSYHSLPSDRQ